MIGAIAKLTAIPDGRDELLRALEPLADHIRSHEPGTLTYVVNLDAGNDAVVWVFEIYADKAAIKAHVSSEAFQTFSQAFDSLLAVPPEIVRTVPLAGKGSAWEA